MIENAPIPANGIMLSVVMHACMVAVGKSEEIQQLRNALDDQDLFPSDVHEYALLYAERMFALGWALRGNPDLLATLPEPD